MKNLLNHSLKTKKIIAREVLILIISLIIPALIFSGLYINSNIKRQSLKIELKQNENIIANYKNNSKHINREAFCNAYVRFIKSKNISIGETAIIKAWNRLVYLAKSDSIEYKWRYEWDSELIEFNKKQGFQTAVDFKEFIIENSSTQKEIDKYNKAITTKWDLESKIVNMGTENNFKVAETLFYISLFILFLLRYFFYLISWCVQILKT